jgi:hypothetical protein
LKKKKKNLNNYLKLPLLAEEKKTLFQGNIWNAMICKDII